VRPPWTVFSDARRSSGRAGLAGVFAVPFAAAFPAARTSPFPRGALAFAGAAAALPLRLFGAGCGARPARVPLRALPETLGMLAAPANLLGGRRRTVEDFPNFFHQILGQTRLGDERITTGLSRAFGNTSERMTGEGHHR